MVARMKSAASTSLGDGNVDDVAGRSSVQTTTPSPSSGSSAATTGLPPLDSEGVLWIAAIECFPIEERIAWVAKMKARVDEINAGRATYDGDPPGAGWSE